ncbi:MAG: YHS domain-containing (seleno)protein [Candidatus Competibacterales bacterium]|nr:YHS domain-containing (seleno)protein [Candidatus Competibacterales bacterium]
MLIRRLLILAALLLSGAALLALAADDAPRRTPQARELGLNGHDPVAYFRQGRAVPGEARLSAEHNGVTYHFANADDRRTFLADPDRYAPRYGGFCAYNLAHGRRKKGDPEQWAIVDGQLYVAASREALEAFQKDTPDYIQRANAIWARIKSRQDQ